MSSPEPLSCKRPPSAWWRLPQAASWNPDCDRQGDQDVGTFQAGEQPLRRDAPRGRGRDSRADRDHDGRRAADDRRRAARGIEALLERCGFAAERIFVIDGSRRSSHGNAYFTGLGREKRVVFFDTLLATLSPGQVESVLAHELAHFKLRHIPQRLWLGLFLGLLGFAVLGYLTQRDWFQPALGVLAPSDATLLLLFVLVSPTFTWIFRPLAVAWSRRHEFQADEFAGRYSSAQDLADALVRLYRDNASTLTPDPLYSFFHDSHPPPAKRIARLRSLCGGTASAPVLR
jgi:STE24 endopeptidase